MKNKFFRIIVAISGILWHMNILGQSATSPQQFPFPDTQASAQWVKVGTYTATQGGLMAKVTLIGHIGYNAANNQDFEAAIYFKTSNGGSVDAGGFAGNSQYFVTGPSSNGLEAVKWVANQAGIAATAYDLYVKTGEFTQGSGYKVETSFGTWTHKGTLMGQNDPGNAGSTVCVATNQQIFGSATTFKKAAYFENNIGIGTVTPTDQLTVVGNASFRGGTTGSIFVNDSYEGGRTYLAMDGNTSNGIAAGSDYFMLERYANKTANIINTEGKLNLKTFGLHDITILPSNNLPTTFKSNGNVGIGTTNPTEKLEIAKEGDVGIRLFNTTANTWDIKNSLYGKLDFIRGGNNIYMRIDQFGNVGVGTPAPQTKLEIAGPANSSGLRFTNLTSQSSGKVLSVNTTGDVILTDWSATQQYPFPDTHINPQWIKVGTYTATQSGLMAKVTLIGHIGYNAANNQDFEAAIYFKTSNGGSVDAGGFAGNSQYFVTGPSSNGLEAVKWVANQAGIAATAYDLYVKIGAFTQGSSYKVETSFGTWTHKGTLMGQNDPGNAGSTVCVATNQQIFGSATTFKKAAYFEDNIGIGTTAIPAGYKFAVAGKIIAESVKVRTLAKGWPDYVFEKTYELPKLETVAKYVQQHKHLPEIPSAAEVEKDGIDLTEMNTKLLKKVEELTLYVIEQQKLLSQQNELNRQFLLRIQKLEAEKK